MATLLSQGDHVYFAVLIEISRINKSGGDEIVKFETEPFEMYNSAKHCYEAVDPYKHYKKEQDDEDIFYTVYLIRRVLSPGGTIARNEILECQSVLI